MDEDPQSTMQRVDVPRGRGDSPREWHLFLLLECGRPLAGGARFSLADVDKVVIGRASKRQVTREGRTLTIGVPDAMMSSSHARLLRAAGWGLVDSESKNGSLVDGRLVKAGELTDGSLLELGSTLFTVRMLPTPIDTPRQLQVEPGDDTALGLVTLVPTYARALAALRQVMKSPMPILLLGDSGTGKELLARAVHRESRRSGAFVPVNCGAIPETLMESQLFGHTRGAFSGAVRDEPGFVRASDRGTLFLDEIGDLPRASQAALLRVLQESEVHSVGSTRPIKVDLRVVSATHRRIDVLSEAGFRTDLYARLAGYVHDLPPLRERREDLGIVVATLLHDLAPGRAVRLVPEVGRGLYAYDWPRNVRELKHALSSAIVFATDGTVSLEHMPEDVRRALDRKATGGSVEVGDAVLPGDATGADGRLRDSLVAALVAHKGNVSEVARAMGRTRMQIHRWMRRFAIDPEDYRRNS
jgi:sigma-54 dependent transcriptional regulator, acetoin dehydrogenase operon transcriptional activator AcoR